MMILKFFSCFLTILVLMSCGIKGPPKPPVVEEINIQSQKVIEQKTIVEPSKNVNTTAESSDNTKRKSKK